MLWNAHLKSPTAALSEAPRKVDSGRRGFLGWREQKLIHFGLCLRGEREVSTWGCVHVFLFAERCPPLGGASRFEFLVCSPLASFSTFGSSGVLPHGVVVFSVFSGEEDCLFGHFARRRLPISDEPALVMLASHAWIRPPPSKTGSKTKQGHVTHALFHGHELCIMKPS